MENSDVMNLSVDRLEELGFTGVEITLVENIRGLYGDDVKVMELLDRYIVERIASSDKVKRCKICGVPVREFYSVDGELACSEKCAEELYGDPEGFRKEMEEAEDDDSVVYYTEEPDYDAYDVYRSDV